MGSNQVFYIKANTGTAKATGFKQRDSKLQPDTFFKAFTVGIWSLHGVTLTALSGQCEDLQSHLKLTRQGLFKRVYAGSKFLKQILNQAMDYAARKVLATETIEVLKQFQDVYLRQ